MNKVALKQQFQDELAKLRQRVADLEAEKRKRKQIERALRQSEEYSATILNNAPSPILVANPDSSIRYVNPAFEALTGFSLMELIGRKVPYPWWTEETLEKTKRDFKEAFRYGVRAFEQLFKKKSGERFLIKITATPIIIDGEFKYYLENWVDITERKKAEEKLQESARWLSTTLKSIGDAVITTDSKGYVTFMNPVAQILTGWNQEDAVGKPLQDVFNIINEKTGQAADNPVTRIVREGIVVGLGNHTVLITREGKKRPIDDSGAPIRDDKGNLIGIALVFHDVTERRRAEEALQLRAHLLNEATDSIIATDLDGNVIYMNEATCQTRGYSKEEMLNMNVKQLVSPKMTSIVNGRLRRIKKEGAIVFESEHVRKDGSVFPVEATARTVNLGDRTIILFVIRDITERKKAEERIIHLNKVLEAVRDVNQLITHKTDREYLINESCKLMIETRGYDLAWILLIDADGNFASIAGAGFKQSVFTRLRNEVKQGHFPPSVNELLTKKTPFTILGDADHQFENPALANAFTGGYAFADKLEFGGTVYGLIMVKLKPELALNPEEQDLFRELVSDIAYGLVGIEWEAERKRSEEALRESEERYRALLELGERIGEAVVMLQDDERGVGMHVYASDEWSRFTGYTKEELLNMSMADIIHPQNRQEAIERHKKRIRGVVLPKLYEVTIIRKDGTEVPVEVTYAYSSYKGKPANVGYIRDISERKKMEEQLIVTDRLASIGELASGVAHELNNPLTGIIGFSELLLKKDVPDDVREDLKVINREAQRTSQVVRNLLTFARRHDTTKKPMDINTAIKTVLDLRAYEQKVHNIEVVTKFDPSLPEITADIFRMQQVFVNIIINAEYFMVEAHGKGTLTITTERKGDIIRASFADDGPGIKKEHMRHLFDPFFSTKEVGRGTGLGLSICHGIVTEHGGQIYAASEPGMGATLTVELPIK